MPSQTARQSSEREPIDLSGAHIPLTDLSNANLVHANLMNANLKGADLQGANLAEATLTNARLIDANLADADLSYANLSYCNLSGTIFSGAKMKGTMFEAAIIDNTDFRETDLTDAIGLDWHKLIHARMGQSTKFPNSLDEKDFLTLLEKIFPPGDWKGRFSGKMKELLSELEKIGDAQPDRNLYGILMQLHVTQEMGIDD